MWICLIACIILDILDLRIMLLVFFIIKLNSFLVSMQKIFIFILNSTTSSTL
jgi:hypothetical protein